MRVHDESRVPEFLKMLQDLMNTHIEVGIFGEDDSKILMIANVNEFGMNIKVTPKMRGYLHSIGLHLSKDTREIKIPERSFIRSGYDLNKNKVMDKGEYLLNQVLNLELPVDTFFNVIGEYIVGLIQDHLTSIKDPPNHPVTIANKRSSNPLIDSGRLRDSITYKVVSG